MRSPSMPNLPTHPDREHFHEQPHWPLLPHTSHSNLQDEERHLPHPMQEVQTAVHGETQNPLHICLNGYRQRHPQQEVWETSSCPPQATPQTSSLSLWSRRWRAKTPILETRERATWFTITVIVPGGDELGSKDAIIVYATTAYLAEVIMLDCTQILLFLIY